MLKELTKFVVIGILAGFIAYSFTLKKPVSIKVTESETSMASISKDSFNQIYASVKDSVVTIKTNIGRGSGVVVTDQGHVVTNEHVIRGARQIQHTSDNVSFPATIVGTDAITDIALLKAVT